MIQKPQEYILIYGATGLVGSELVNFLQNENYHVVVLVRNKKKAQKLFNEKVHIFITNDEIIQLQNRNNWRCGAIINLAGTNIGAKRWTAKNKKEILESRIKSVDFLGKLVDQLKHKPKVWLQASAVGYYGYNVAEVTDESGKKGHGFLADIVAKWEHAMDHLHVPNTRKVCLRFGIVITKKGGFLKQLLRISNLGVVALPFVKDQKIPWIHITDLVKLIDFVLNNESLTGKINTVTHQPFAMEKLKNLLQKNTLALLKMNIPKFVFNLFVGNQKTREMLLADQNVISSVLPKMDFNFEYTDIEQVFTSKA